jgi:hypothetical protein
MSIQSNFPAIAPSLLLDFANTKQLDNRITFTRSTPAVYYDGKTTAMAEQNLFQQSQTFENSPWSPTATTISANVTTAPDGTNTADSLVPTTEATANHQFAQSLNLVANANYTISIYVKAFGYTKFAFRESAQTGAYATFDLASTGSVIETGNVGDVTILGATITSVVNSWFRVTISFVSTLAGSFGMGFFPLNENYTTGQPYNAGTATGNGTSGVYIWGAQAEQRATATAYTATTTQPITNYIPVLLSAGGNQARFDCNPTTGESLGLLIEEARTNLQVYSSAFQDNEWTKLDLLIGINAITAPDGTLTGDKLIPNTSNTFHITYGQAVSGSGSFTMSVFAKAGGYPRLAIRESNVTGNGAMFDLSSGTVISLSNATATITPVGNGWYRCTATVAWGTGYNLGIAVAQSTDTSLLPSFAGNGFNGVYVWGAQLEAGAYATSYIATTSASATRTADAASMVGTNFSSWFNAGQGSAYVEGTGAYAFSCTEGGNQSYANFWLIGDISTTGVDRYITGNYNSTNQWEGRQFSTKAQKMSFAYAFNDIAGTYNGTLQFTDSFAILPINLIAAYISPNMTGWVKKVSYYPLRLTNTNLQALTS